MAREGWANGYARKRGESWEARWYDPDGRPRSKRGFGTERQALDFAANQQAAARAERDGRGTYVDPNAGRVRFERLAAEWLGNHPGQKDRTTVGYESQLRNHVLPYFGDRYARDIGKPDVRRFIATMRKKGAQPGTIRNVVRGVLGPVLELAVDHGYIDTNPVRGVKLPQSETKEEMIILTEKEVWALAKELGDHWGRVVLFATYSGMRAGEIAALQGKHIDRANLTVHVERSLAEVNGSRIEGIANGLHFGPTKTYSRRKVRIPPSVAADIPKVGHEDLVFTTPRKAVIRWTNFRNRDFKPAVRKVLPPEKHGLRFHDLRHTHVSILIREGYNPKQIQAQLGHSSITVTFDRYGKLFPDWNDEMPNVLEAVYRRGADEDEEDDETDAA